LKSLHGPAHSVYFDFAFGNHCNGSGLYNASRAENMTGYQQNTDLSLLEQLRQKSCWLDDLQKHIFVLENCRAELIDTNTQLLADLDRYRQIKEEWDWFFDHSLDMLCMAGVDGYFKRVNDAFLQTLGYSREEILSRPLNDFIHPDDVEKTNDELKHLGEGDDTINFENRYRHKNGEWRWLCWTCPGLSLATDHLYAIARDVTAIKRREEEIIFRAEHDHLTGLANRAAFDKALEQALARVRRNPAQEVGLLLLDLDGFKAINDTRGHHIGDLVLKNVAERLRSFLRTIDIICRFGGDEFAVIVEGPAPLLLESLAERIIATISQPIALDAETAAVGCSIGISTFPSPAQDADSLYKQADAAMYAVKKNGKNAHCRFTDDPMLLPVAKGREEEQALKGSRRSKV
jgi:diguanylate cyclase (GGDEF)-like protein/PAS domain S-box-containing protein